MVSHASKILPKTIYRRIECELDKDQFGYQKDAESSEAIQTLDRSSKNG